MLHLMLGCCLAFLLLIVVAPFAGPWGSVLVRVALLEAMVVSTLSRLFEHL